MEALTDKTPETSNREVSTGRKEIYTALLFLLLIVGALLYYKGAASIAVLQAVGSSGILKPRANVIPNVGDSEYLGVLARSVNYFLLILPALTFGILISGAVRAFVSPQWITRVIGVGRVRSQLMSAAAGTPLMLCSCCVAPIFSGMYERTARLGSSLTLMLAAPSLNPAALILTFMLFDAKIGAVRLCISLAGVLLTGAVAERLFNLSPPVCSIDAAAGADINQRSIIFTFLRSCGQVALQTVPLIAGGVVLSMLIAEWLPVTSFTSPGLEVAAVLLIASISVLLALPTFFEIPLALALLAAGMSPGAAVAMLIAGPAINLPSLLTIGRSTNWKVAGMVAAIVWLLAVTGGLLVNQL